MSESLQGNEWYWRLARTVAQGVLGVIVANLDLLVGATALAPEWRALVFALVMAVLSPAMAELGKHAGGGTTGDPAAPGDPAEATTPEGGDAR